MPDLEPWHLTYLENPDYSRVDLVKEGANSQAKIALFKSRGGTDMSVEEILKSLKPEHQKVLTDALAAKEDEIAKAKADLEAAQAVAKAKDLEGQSEEDIVKSIKDPAIRALMETQIAKAKAAEAEVKKAREEREHAEAIAKAKEVPNLGTEEATLAEVYKKLGGVEAELRDEIFGIFKAANALITEGGVFTEVGKAAGTETPVASNEAEAWAAIEKAAEEHVAKGVSKSQAISKAIKENPALYDAYIKAQHN
jgi:hypothetical protein